MIAMFVLLYEAPTKVALNRQNEELLDEIFFSPFRFTCEKRCKENSFLFYDSSRHLRV